MVSSEDWGGPISPPGLLFDIGRQSLGRKPSRTAALDNFPLHRSGLGGNRCLQDILFSSFSDRSLIQVYLSAKSCVGSTLSNLLSWFIIPSVIWPLPTSQTFTLLPFHTPAILVFFRVLNMPGPLPSFRAPGTVPFSHNALLPATVMWLALSCHPPLSLNVTSSENPPLTTQTEVVTSSLSVTSPHFTCLHSTGIFSCLFPVSLSPKQERSSPG